MALSNTFHRIFAPESTAQRYTTKMSDKKAPYCLMPFLHFHVGNQGVAKACCVANIPFGNINEQSMTDIWHGEAINALREKFAKGQPDNRCAVCQNIEASGGKSIRQETFDKFSQVLPSPTPPLPIYFDIRFSNVCNFRCRTCWHGASSKWFSDAKALGNNIGQKAILNNIQDFDRFIEQMGPALLQAEEFYFAGGEPLVTEEHYQLLEWLIEHKATQARLRYNTNFSKLRFKQYDILELWKQFPEVEVLASLDAGGSLGEYIRKEMNWTEVLANREKIRALPHVQFKIAPTVSVLNAAALPSFYLECIALKLIGPSDIYINILERPQYYNVQILPSQKKEEVAQAFLAVMQEDMPQQVLRQFQEILDYMFAKNGKDSDWASFLSKTAELNALREEQNPMA